MVKKKQDTVYATIMDPISFRRELLYSIKLLLVNLKTNQKLVEIRKEKLRKFMDVQDIFKEVDSLYSELKGLFPDIKIHGKIAHDMKIEKVKEEKIELPKHEVELDKLEQELMEVEEELKKLN